MVNKQDYLNAITQNIEIVRGDTLAFNFQLCGLGSQSAYEALDFLFAVAEHYNNESVIEIESGNGIELDSYDVASDTATFSVFMDPSKTKDLDLTRYYYDLQFKDTNNVVTLMRGYFTLLYDVAD